MTSHVDLLLTLPSIVLFAGALVLLTIKFLIPNRSHVIEWLSYGFCGVALALLINQFASSANTRAFSGSLAIDLFGTVMSIVIVFSTLLSLLLAKSIFTNVGGSDKETARFPEYCSMLLMISGGLMIMAMARDFITLFLSVELVSIGSYIISGFTKTNPKSNEAQVKYFVMGSFATAVMLYGMVLVYGATQDIFIDGPIRDSWMGIAGSLLIVIGFCFKIGAVPFHMWVPDVYEGAPVAAVGFMSVTIKAAGLAVMLRIAKDLLNGHAIVLDVIYAITILTMLIGNILALKQTSLRRMLAYSSIAHTGYALIGVAVYCFRPANDPWTAVILYVMAYSFMTLGSFAFLILLGGDNYQDLSGMAKARPMLALCVAIFMLSLAGFPPTAGFFAKFYIFKSAVDAGHILLAVVGVLATIISVYYYLKVIVLMYMHPLPEGKVFTTDTNTELCVTLCLAFVLVIGILPANYLAMAIRATP